MRQCGDAEFIDLLSNVRTADTQPCDIRLVESRVIKPQSSNYPQNALHIFAENTSAKRHNLEMLYSIEGNILTIPPKDQFPKSIPRQKIIEVLNRNQSETRGLAGVLDIKLNARVILTVNIDLPDRLVDGQLGTVYKCIRTDSERNVSKIYIKIDDSKAGLKSMNSYAFVKQQLWVPIEKTEFDIKIKSSKTSSPVIKRTQYPLMLAWTCTVLKVQGLSLTQIVGSFQLLKQRQFNYGQICVALSRVTTLEGLYILGPFLDDSIRGNPLALVKYSGMRTESILSVEVVEDTHQESLIVILLNVRSLHKHVTDLALDERLKKSEIICLTETQLIPNSDIPEIATLQGFEVAYNNNQDRFESTAECTKVDTHNFSY